MSDTPTPLINVEKLSPGILNGLREMGNTITEIEGMTPDEAFDEYVYWITGKDSGHLLRMCRETIHEACTSPTPRTDEEEFWHECRADGLCIKVVNADFARELERELAAQSWQPIETAPKDGTIIDLWERPHGKRDGYRCCNQHWGYHSWINGEPRGIEEWGPYDGQYGPPPDPIYWRAITGPTEK